jgi:uncharacterized protein
VGQRQAWDRSGAATQAGPVAPTEQAGSRLALHPAGGMRVSGGFWGALQQLNRDTTIPHGIAMLEESGSLHNLRIAAGRADGDYALPRFRDSDVYKVLEAVAWERRRGTDPAQEAFLADTAGLLLVSQRPDGYLNSHTEVVLGGRRWGDPAMGHELYCAGHLLQAAVADLRTSASGTTVLGTVAGRFADLIERELHAELAGFVPGHPEIETALTEFGRATGRAGLTSVAAELIGRRGKSALSWQWFSPSYFSDDVPFADADEIRGHAVRALYLLSGAADVYAETGDERLMRASLAQWNDMVTAKTYLTGGVGSRHDDESFGDRFELPPDRAYCETCAAIASVMWNWRLLLITGEARFADLMERTLFNAVLPGLGLDGRSFCYVNPLHARAETSRQGWYTCACCPPNVMRLLASLDHYVATVTADGVQLHQYASGQLRATLGAGREVAAQIDSALPYAGHVRVRLTKAPPGPAGLALRQPGWAGDAELRINGARTRIQPGADGYLRLGRRWAAGDEISVEFPLTVRRVRADPRVDAVRGCVAFERGPLVYCIESQDRLDGLAVPADVMPRDTRLDIAGHRVVALSMPAVARRAPGAPGGSAAAWPYRPSPRELPADRADLAALPVTAIPYYAWANRGPSRMRIWLPEVSLAPAAGPGSPG